MSYNLTTMQSIYHNEDEIIEITHNGSSVYQKSSGPDYTEPFYIKNINNTTDTVEISNRYSGSSAPNITVEYSTDRINWSSGTTHTGISLTLNPGDKVYFRANTSSWASYDQQTDIWYNNTITCSSEMGGNIMSLLYGSNFNGQREFPTVSSHNFAGLFIYSNVVKADELLLPATTLTTGCYWSMFLYCSYLTTTPELPATTAAVSCYRMMFIGCTALTTAPAISITNSAASCCQLMFESCTALTTAPATLPATTLADYCYNQMFAYCKSLTTAPALPATTLADSCYREMFSGCTALTTAPALPATTLADSCYRAMFSNCTALTTSPVLNATTLVSDCYNGMFRYCSSLNYVTCLAETTVTDATSYWLYRVSSTGAFIKSPDGTFWTTGASGIPTDWTVINDSTLPAANEVWYTSTNNTIINPASYAYDANGNGLQLMFNGVVGDHCVLSYNGDVHT